MFLVKLFFGYAAFIVLFFLYAQTHHWAPFSNASRAADRSAPGYKSGGVRGGSGYYGRVLHK